jgi:hypothetical protein
MVNEACNGIEKITALAVVDATFRFLIRGSEKIEEMKNCEKIFFLLIAELLNVVAYLEVLQSLDYSC